MSEQEPKDALPPRLRWLIVGVLALALPVVVGAAVRMTLDPPGLSEALAVVLFLALALLAELKPVPLEEDGMSSVSLAFVFILSGVILFGWEYGVAISAASALAAQVIERKPLERTAFNTAVYALSAFAAALPAIVFGEQASRDAVVITVFAIWGGAAFVAVNFVCISLAISFHQGIPLPPLLKENVRLVGPAFAIQAFLAALAAALWMTDPRLLMLMAGPLFTVTLYQRSSLASRRATRDAHTDSLTRLGNNRSYELALASAVEQGANGPMVGLCLLDVDDFKQINDIYGHQLGDGVLAEVATILADDGSPSIQAFRMGGDEFAVLVTGERETLRQHLESLYRRISASSFPHGEAVTVSVGLAAFPDDALEVEELERKADGALYWAKQNGKNRWCAYSPDVVRVYSVDELERRAEHQARLRAAENLVRVVDAKDAYTGAHSERVALLVEGIARRVGLDEEIVEQLKLAGRLHDLGKIAVSDSILQKPTQLTLEEKAHVSTHPHLGASLLDGMEIRPVDVWIRHHHEHWDGSGYPNGLEGDEIPLGSRVILVADAYDAMTSTRSYSPAATPEQALAELQRMAGLQFDAVVVAALESYLTEAGLVGVGARERAESLDWLVA
jgi:diguanylate cyclase (GGDEF)-like protein